MFMATCSLEPEENEEVIRDFLAKHPEYTLHNAGKLLPAETAKLINQDGKCLPRLRPMGWMVFLRSGWIGVSSKNRVVPGYLYQALSLAVMRQKRYLSFIAI